jgi:hypothetical protein
MSRENPRNTRDSHARLGSNILDSDPGYFFRFQNFAFRGAIFSAVCGFEKTEKAFTAV